MDNETIKGLLNNQETVQAVDFSDIKDNNPLTKNNIKPWHQETVTGLRMQDNRLRRVQVPFERKGKYKLSPNNPRSRDGIVHDYCPPEHVRSELDKLY